MEELYRIEEETTSGWSVVEPTYVGMTREQTKETWDFLVQRGHNPNSLRIVREQ